VPALLIKIVNRSSTPAELLSYGEAYFSVPSTPLMDTNIGSTRLELTAADRGNNLTVPPQKFRWISACFLNESHAAAVLKQEDIGLSIMLQTRDHGMLHTESIPFRRKVIGSQYLELDIEPRVHRRTAPSSRLEPGRFPAECYEPRRAEQQLGFPVMCACRELIRWGRASTRWLPHEWT
jgi:hypothetical protein